ncbi:MAG: hypothetical protein EON53_10870 [Actinomycetales bacterium]|nr:MAG: hypothetical protein EON53_10870 [Actinomycetales bacterium]
MSAAAALARLVVVLLGVWVGVLGSLVHRTTVEVMGADRPGGLVLSLVTVALVAVACGFAVRVGAAWFGLGWTLVLLLQQLQPSGSYLVAADAIGWTWMIGGLGVCAAAVLLAPRLER